MGNHGGKREGSGRKPKAFQIPEDNELAQQKLKYEKLLLAEALPLAYERLKKAMQSESNTFLVKYIFDRVYGRPREADKLTGADETLRRELAISEAKKRVELLEEQIAITRLNRLDKERKEGATSNGRDEGRFYPSGGQGVGPCGRYHATLDASIYPGSPFVKPDMLVRILSGPSCPVCGDNRFTADPEIVTFTNPSPTNNDPGDDLFQEDNEEETEQEEEL